MTSPNTPVDVEALEKVALAVPDHLILSGWQRSKNPVFGEWYVYADDGRGMGRQHIANTPACKSYGFTDLSEFIATFDPPTVLRLLAERGEVLEALELALEMLGRLEPGDSRTVSSEFVAMAAVAAGTADEACMNIIRKAILSAFSDDRGALA